MKEMMLKWMKLFIGNWYIESMTMGIMVDYCNSIQMMLCLMEAIADKLVFVLRKR
jgi:hypothetical protein